MKFIHPENQKILWNKISNTAYFNDSIFSLEEKHIWFKNIIQQFYEKYKNTYLGTKEIKELNRTVILYMINELNSINKYQQIIQPTIQPTFTNDSSAFMTNNSSAFMTNSSSAFMTNSSSAIMTNSSSAIMTNSSSAIMTNSLKRDVENKNAINFQERQREYENMLKTETPADINFSEKIEDDVITNMEELVKQHMLQREMDIEPLKNNLENGGELKKMTDINDVFSILQKPKESLEKHIQWSNDLEENHFIDFQSEKSISPMSSPPLSENLKVNEMEREITNMREEINILYEKIDMLTNEVKTLREINRESEPVFFEMSDI